MALGGGTYVTQNKVLPGTYMNFVSVANASLNISDRGYGALALELDFGTDNEIFEVTASDFRTNSKKIFGYEYSHEKMRGLRDLFLNLNVLYAYRLNSGKKASNKFAEAKYTGVRGNDIQIVISQNIDDNAVYEVSTFLQASLVDTQYVSVMSELTSNDYVVFKRDAELELTAGISLEDGTNGETTGSSHQDFLDKIEPYSFNALGVITNDDTLKTLYSNFTKRMRDEVGSKFQTVIYNCNADYEGVVNLKNKVTDDEETSLIYWVLGALAGVEVNKSCLNKTYDGEFEIECSYTQSELEKAITNGEFTLHKVNSYIKVLSDINSLTTVTEEKGQDFKENQTIRVLDQIANDVALIFNEKYLGVIPNDEAGRLSLWADIVKHHETLQDLRAIEGFSDSDIEITQGDSKKSIVITDKVTPVNAMAQLYQTVYVG